jgi:biopolymer transport protein ExbD
MRLARQRRAGQGEANIVPLINVVLLLLVFFLLTGTIEPKEALPIALPEAAAGTRLETAGLTLLVAADGRVALEDEPVDVDALGARLADLAADASLPPLTVRADAATPASRLMPLLQTARAAGFDRVRLVTVASPPE